MKGIYVIKEKNGDPVYVGRSRNIYGRWAAHLENYPYDKYDYEVLEIVEGNINGREQHWIDEMNTLLDGDNKVKAVATRKRYLSELPPVFETGYRKNRIIALLKTFDGEMCHACNETTSRYLYWFPYHKAISSGFLLHGKKTKARAKALELIDKSRPLCLNCGADKLWGEEKALY